MISWGELFLAVGAGFFLVGKKDLPKVAFTFGTQVGRVVGFLQGARARVDRFAEHSELRQLQNELRSGLRELDAVRSEMAVSMSPGGMMGRSLGSMTANANLSAARGGGRGGLQSSGGARMIPPSAAAAAVPQLGDAQSYARPLEEDEDQQHLIHGNPVISSTVHQTTAAVAEQEWVKQGIDFQSAAERGAGLPPSHNREQSGSAILSSFIQQSLIFDQYDRTVAEQDAVLQSKVSSILQAKQDAKNKKDEQKKE